MPITTTNDLLRRLGRESSIQIKPHLSRVQLTKNSLLGVPGQIVTDVYFLESGLASLTWPASPAGIDIALVGNEGLVGCSAVRNEAHIFGVVARTDVTALRMSAMDFIQDAGEIPDLATEISQFTETLWRQIAECAYSNARATVEQRLARWIALASARLHSNTVCATHDTLAFAIGCRRAGVTVALHMLEGEHILKSWRGRLVIRDRDALLARSAGTKPESEHATPQHHPSPYPA